MKTSEKNEVFRGNEPIRTKVFIENETAEQVSHFSYLECDLTYEYEMLYKRKYTNSYFFVAP